MDRALVVAGLLAAVALAAVLLARRPRAAPRRIDPADFELERDGGVAVVGFSSPYCVPCREWEAALGMAGIDFVKVNVSERPDLATRYRIASTPLVLAVRRDDGRVVAAYHEGPRQGEPERLAELADN